MIRLPNPKSDPISIRAFFRNVVYAAYQQAGDPGAGLDHDAFAEVAARIGAVSSKGQIGDAALVASFVKDRSLDAIYNQMKMLTEVYRLLGWLRPLPGSRGRFLLTPLGEQVAAFRGSDFDTISDTPLTDERRLWEHCLVNIVFPHPHSDANHDHSQRPFVLILKVASAVCGYVTRDELILTAFQVEDDRQPDVVLDCAAKIQSWREPGGAASYEYALEATLATTGITLNTMRNYTRLPIALVHRLGWFEKLSHSELPGNVQMQFVNELGADQARRAVYLHLADGGYEVLEKLSEGSSC